MLFPIGMADRAKTRRRGANLTFFRRADHASTKIRVPCCAGGAFARWGVCLGSVGAIGGAAQAVTAWIMPGTPMRVMARQRL